MGTRALVIEAYFPTCLRVLITQTYFPTCSRARLCPRQQKIGAIA
jgi:hypothetical protein